MKKLLSLAAVLGLICVGLLMGCQKKSETSAPEAPAAPSTNAPAAPAAPAATNAPAQ